ncbi:NADH-quinone oxidoreductase subunit C [Streptomyces sp. NRRL F-4428]|uniref:NADH-quinone oxidoreductase subunit C n=1 Tax=Streptomyces sp. NRRL F-4428 TaxID=1609137 RepID=UPI00099B74A5|nr:NADH-quinone oxidoreductase subunit C [Streptomyces sp. NRRL F-4428]
MNLYDSLPDAAPTVFGAEAVAELSYDVLTVDVPVGSWIPSLEIARDKLGCTYFDWLSAVDEPGTGFRVCAHVASLENGRVRRLLLRTTVPHGAPSLPSAVAVYAGAEWHERETFEMFGITFTDHPNLVHLLLPENFEGHPLRKDFVLAARVAKAWPGAKEPGEAHDPDAPKRRQMLPPGVPDPNDWGPLKGQLPPAPARPARTPRAAGAAGAAARTPREGAPVRRTRSVAEGSATQAGEAAVPEAPARPPRRTRSVADGSASQAAAGGTQTPGAGGQADAPARPARRTRSAADGSASQAPDAAAANDAVNGAAPGTEAPGTEAPGAQAPDGPAPDAPARAPRRTRSAADGSASQAAEAAPGTDAAGPDTGAPAAEPAARAPRRAAPRSSDAPWHDPKPAFDEPAPGPAPKAAPEAGPAPEPEAGPAPETEAGPAPGRRPTEPETETRIDPTTDKGGDA